MFQRKALPSTLGILLTLMTILVTTVSATTGFSESFSYENDVVPSTIDILKTGGSVRELDVQDAKLKAVIDTNSYGDYTSVRWRPRAFEFGNQDMVTLEFEGYEKTGYNAGNNYGGFTVLSVDVPIDHSWGPQLVPRLGFLTQNRYHVDIDGYDASAIKTKIMYNAYQVSDGTHLYKLELNHAGGTRQEGVLRFYRDGVLVGSHNDVSAFLNTRNTIEFHFTGDDPYGAIYTWDDVTIDVSVHSPLQLTTNQGVVTVSEGDSATNSGSVSGGEGDNLGLSSSVGTVTNNDDGTWSWSFPTVDGPDETQVVTIHTDDGHGCTAETSFDLIVNNVAPSIDAISAPAEPVSMNDQPVSAEVTFSDPGTGDTHDVAWEWGDSNGDTQAFATSPTAASHTYVEAGIYEVQVTVTDDDSAADSDTYEYIVIYDPEGGFVTGGGWIWSEAGWCQLDDLYTGAEGKANFGFVSKYKKGADVPTGNTEFIFQAADLKFHSTSYDWLVVTGSDYAKFKGVGTINSLQAPNGQDYKFMLWAGDGTGDDGADTFRIKIWYEVDDTEIVVYDNDTDQEIAGGNIVVHTK